MSIKKSTVLAVTVIMTFGAMIACGEKKQKEDHEHSNAEDKATEMVKETSKVDAKIEEAKMKTADSLRKVDSLRQVKEHGHAH